MRKLYTVGHSNHAIGHFMQLLLINNINCIIDVRSTPYSQYAYQYNIDHIKQYLKDRDIHYIYLGKELGARRNDKDFYTNGYLDFAKVRAGDHLFKAGIKRIIEGLKKDFRIAMMCTEKDPIDCHRSILISKALLDIGQKVEHIKDDGSIETHEDLEQRLIYLYFPDFEQSTIFDMLNGSRSPEKLLESAYAYKNKEIGYKLLRES